MSHIIFIDHYGAMISWAPGQDLDIIPLPDGWDGVPPGPWSMHLGDWRGDGEYRWLMFGTEQEMRQLQQAIVRELGLAVQGGPVVINLPNMIAHIRRQDAGDTR